MLKTKTSSSSSKPKKTSLDSYEKIGSNIVYKEIDLRKKISDNLQKEVREIKESGMNVVLVDSSGSNRTKQFLAPGSDPYAVRKDMSDLLDSNNTSKKVIKVPGEVKNPVLSPTGNIKVAKTTTIK